MPAEQGFGLNKVQGLLPESGPSGQQHQPNPVALSKMWLFDLPFEHNELLAQHRIFNYQVFTAPSHIGENASSENNGNGLRPLFKGLFQPASEVFQSSEDSSDHSLIGSVDYQCQGDDN
jgi:hypothetical protein